MVVNEILGGCAAEDLPMNQIDQCSEKDSSKLCIRELSAGEENGSIGTVLLHGSNRLDGCCIAEWNDGFIGWYHSPIPTFMRFDENPHRRKIYATKHKLRYARMHESAANVDGKSTRKPTASHEAVDGYVFTECWLLVREQALETTTHLQVKPRYLTR
jgi:hypothetical protein